MLASVGHIALAVAGWFEVASLSGLTWCPSFFLCYYDRIPDKSNVRKERFILSQSLRAGLSGSEKPQWRECDTLHLQSVASSEHVQLTFSF